MRRFAAAAVCLLSLLSCPALSFGRLAVPEAVWANAAKKNPLIKDWLRRLQGIEETLRSSDVKTAKKMRNRASKLYLEMIDRVIEGEGACELFGRVLFYRAVAEARLGELDAAAWHWQEAQSLLADEKTTLADEYPDVAVLLKSWLLPETAWETLSSLITLESYGKIGEIEIGPGAPRPTPPEVIKKVPARYPEAVRRVRKEGVTHVQCKINESGVLREPVVLQSCGVVGFDVAAMEAMRLWRYKPATIEGKPIAIPLIVKWEFHLKH